MRVKINMKHILTSSLLLFRILRREPSVDLCESEGERKKVVSKNNIVEG